MCNLNLNYIIIFNKCLKYLHNKYINIYFNTYNKKLKKNHNIINSFVYFSILMIPL